MCRMQILQYEYSYDGRNKIFMLGKIYFNASSIYIYNFVIIMLQLFFDYINKFFKNSKRKIYGKPNYHQKTSCFNIKRQI